MTKKKKKVSHYLKGIVCEKYNMGFAIRGTAQLPTSIKCGGRLRAFIPWNLRCRTLMKLVLKIW